VSIGGLVALVCAVAIAGCPRSPKTPPASPPAAAPRGSLFEVETCPKAPVEQPICTADSDQP
jgi:hypothetical protein